MSKAREIVLRLVAEGKITVEEAEELLDGINGGAEGPFAESFSSEKGEPGARMRAGYERAQARAEEKRARAEQRREEARARAREARERAKEKSRQKARAKRRGYGGGFEFNFPWDQEGWQWPWEQEDWRWPWEQEDWQWGKTSTEEADEAVSSLEVPEEARLVLNITGGDLAIRGSGQETTLNIVAPEARKQVSMEDGVINISSAGEDFAIEVPENVKSMEISHSGGDAEITKLQADMIAKVGGGDMVVSEFTGNIQASVEGGDAALVHINSTSVEVRTEGGDTDLSMDSPIEEGSIILSSNDDISLALISDSRCEISAAAGGDVAHSLPPEALEIIEENEKYLEAKLNGGGAEITLSSSSGDISIRAV